MAAETKDCKVFLTSSEKAICSIFFTLKVPNFLTLPEYDDVAFDVRSPTFEFADATWCFRFEDRKKEELATGFSPKMFDVDMIRLNSKIQQHAILYNVALLDANAEKYDSCCNTTLFEEDKDDLICNLHTFVDFPSYDKSDILTVVIHLVSGKSLEEQEPVKINTDVETLSQDFKKLFLTGENHDLTLRVSDKEFRVHQDILKVRCQVFAAMLTHDMIEKEKGVIDVTDCGPQAMEQLLMYVYCGKVEGLSSDNVLGLYYAADKYQMMSLKEECTKFIKQSFSPSIICDVVQLALNHSDTDLLECATEYYVNHVSEILLTIEWMSFMKSNTTTANELLIKSIKKCNCKKS